MEWTYDLRLKALEDEIKHLRERVETLEKLMADMNSFRERLSAATERQV